MFVLNHLKSYIVIKNKIRRPKYDEYRINNVHLGIQNKKEISTLYCNMAAYTMEIRRNIIRINSNITIMYGFETTQVIIKNNHAYHTYYFSTDMKTLINCCIICYEKLECKKLEYSILRDDSVRINITREWTGSAGHYMDCEQNITYIYEKEQLQNVKIINSTNHVNSNNHVNSTNHVNSNISLYYINGILNSIYI